MIITYSKAEGSGWCWSPTPIVENHTLKLLVMDGNKLEESQTQAAGTLALYVLDSGLSVLHVLCASARNKKG